MDRFTSFIFALIVLIPLALLALWFFHGGGLHLIDQMQ